MTAGNAGGQTATASAPTAVVQAADGAGGGGGGGTTSSDSTLGRAAVGDSLAGGGNGYVAVSGPYTLTKAGSTGKLVGYVKGGPSTVPLRGVIYADNGGAPGPFVAATGQVAVLAGAAPAWIDLPFANTVDLPAGTYWLGYWFGGSTTVGYDNVAGGGQYVSATYSPTGDPPAAFGRGMPSIVALSLYAALDGAVAPPANTSLPAISGTAVEGKTLTATTGGWDGNPTGFSYRWRSCDGGGGSCSDIPGATGSSYTLQSGDVGQTVRVVVTAAGAGGSTSATSQPTSVVGPGTLGKTTVGASMGGGGGGYLAVSGPYTLASAASATKLVGYLKGGSSPVSLRAVIYADNGNGAPGAFVAASTPVGVPAGAGAGWVDFPLGSAPDLPAGKYWVGYWFGSTTTVAFDGQDGAGRYVSAAYSPTGDPPSLSGSSTSVVALSLYAALG